jgi:hypothetical protein
MVIRSTRQQSVLTNLPQKRAFLRHLIFKSYRNSHLKLNNRTPPRLQIALSPFPQFQGRTPIAPPAGFPDSWARDWAPLWQRDMSSDWWLIGTGGRLCIRCLPQDRRGGSLEGGSGLLFRGRMLVNIRQCPRVGTCRIGRGRRQSPINSD